MSNAKQIAIFQGRNIRKIPRLTDKKVLGIVKIRSANKLAGRLIN